MFWEKEDGEIKRILKPLKVIKVYDFYWNRIVDKKFFLLSLFSRSATYRYLNFDLSFCSWRQSLLICFRKLVSGIDKLESTGSNYFFFSSHLTSIDVNFLRLKSILIRVEILCSFADKFRRFEPKYFFSSNLKLPTFSRKYL